MPLTKGTARTPFDTLLYAALLVMLLVALFSDGTGPIPALDTTVGVLPMWQIWTILGLLAVLGLRDKVIFLAARGEVYALVHGGVPVRRGGHRSSPPSWSAWSSGSARRRRSSTSTSRS